MLRDSIQTSNKYFKVLYGPLDHVFYITLHNRPYKNLVLFDENFRQIRKIDVSHVSSFQSRCIHSQSTINVRNTKQTNVITKYLLEIYFGSTNRNPLTFTTVSYKDCEILCNEIERAFGVRVYSYGSLNTAFKNALKNASEEDVVSENYDEFRIKNEKYQLFKEAHDLKNLYQLVQLESDELSEPVAEISSNFPVVIEGNMEDGSFLCYRDIRSKNNLNSSVYKVEWYLSKSVGSNDEFFEMPSETSDTFYLSEYMVGHFVMVKVYRALKFNENRSFVYSIAQRGPIYPNTLLCHHLLINSTKKSDFHDALISTLDLDVLFNVVDKRNKFGVYQPFNPNEVISNFEHFQKFLKTVNNDVLNSGQKGSKIKNTNNKLNKDNDENNDKDDNNNNTNAVTNAENSNLNNSKLDNLEETENEQNKEVENNNQTNINNTEQNNMNEENFLTNISDDVLGDVNTQTTSPKYNNIRLKVPNNVENNNQQDTNNNNNSNVVNNNMNNNNLTKHENKYDNLNENENDNEDEDIEEEESNDKQSLEFLYGKEALKYNDNDQKDLHEATTVSDFSDSDQVKTFGVDEYFREDYKKKKFSILNLFKSESKKKALKEMISQQQNVMKKGIIKNKNQPKLLKGKMENTNISSNNNSNTSSNTNNMLMNTKDNNNNQQYVKKVKEMEKKKNFSLLGNKKVMKKHNSPILNKRDDLESSNEEDLEFEQLEMEDGFQRMVIAEINDNEDKPVKRRVIKDSILLMKEKRLQMKLFNKNKNNKMDNMNNNDSNNNNNIQENKSNKDNNNSKQLNKKKLLMKGRDKQQQKLKEKPKGKKVIFDRKYEKQLKAQRESMVNDSSPSSNSEVEYEESEDSSEQELDVDNNNTNTNEVHFHKKRNIKDSILLMKEKREKMKLLKKLNKVDKGQKNKSNNNKDNKIMNEDDDYNTNYENDNINNYNDNMVNNDLMNNKDMNKNKSKNKENKHKTKGKGKGKKVIFDRKYEKQMMSSGTPKSGHKGKEHDKSSNKKKDRFFGFIGKITSPKSKVEKVYPQPNNDMVVKKNTEEMNLERFKKYLDTIQFVPVKLKICLNELVITFGLCSLSLKWKMIEPEKSDMLTLDQFPSIQKQLDSNLYLIYNSVIPIKVTLRTQSTFQRNVLYHSILFNKYRTNYSIDRCERELENCYYNGVRTAYTRVCRSLYESKKRNEDQNKNIEEQVNF